MKRFKILLLALALIAGWALPARQTADAASPGGVTVLCYHHVGPYHTVGPQANTFTVTPQTLRAHFDYLRQHGYAVISLDDYIRFNRGEKTLPEKSVLLTFDDAYESFYHQVFPLLKEYDYPATAAMVGIWAVAPAPTPDRIMSWDQLRELDKSGLVEIVSHSYNLHYSVISNAYGDPGHAASNLEFVNGRFETQADYQQRIRQDMKKGQELFERELGHKLRALVWPYGEYNEFSIDAALAAGYEVTFGLEGGMNRQGTASLRAGKRGLIWGNPDIGRFTKFVADGGFDRKNERIVQVDIDTLYDADPVQMNANIRLLLDRLARTNATSVYLQAFSDKAGDGRISSVYFANSVAPVRADVFSHIASRLRDARVMVYAWIPTLSGQWLTQDHPEDRIAAYTPKGLGWYDRATPFSPRVREQLRQMVRDLAMYAPINGVLFQDDLFMTDYEDFSPAARQVFRERFDRELNEQALQDPEIRRQWTRLKSDEMNRLSEELIGIIRTYRPNSPSARNIYAEAVLNPRSFEWFSQDYEQYLKIYDFTVIMAYPYMEKQGDRAVAWLQTLADAALKDKANSDKVLFKLQNYDWSKKRWVTRAELSEQVRALRAKGAKNIGFYPENLFSNLRDDSPF